MNSNVPECDIAEIIFFTDIFMFGYENDWILKELDKNMQKYWANSSVTFDKFLCFFKKL